jgi:hypothetical protein
VTKTTAFTFTLTVALTLATSTVTPNTGNFTDSVSVAMQSASSGGSASLQNTRAGVTYYVSKTGSDSNTCSEAQNVATPKLTIAAGITCLQANPLGNRLEIRGGTYPERLRSADLTFPTGSNWSNAPTIAAYSGETVLLQPPPGTLGEVLGLTDPNIQYLVFDGLILDAINVDDVNPDPSFGPRNGNVVSIHGGAGNIKFVNCEIKNAGGMGIYGIVKGLLWVASSKIHHNGDVLGDHGIYAVGDFLIENGEFHNNSGYGLQLYPTASTGTIRGNFIHSNASGITVVGTFDINNNVFANQSKGVEMGRESIDGRIYDNTFYDLTAAGLEIGYCYDGVEASSCATGTIAKNNTYESVRVPLDLQPRSSITQNDELCYNVASTTGCTTIASGPVTQRVR